MWGKIVAAATKVFSILYKGIKWITVSEKLVEYYMVWIELVNEDELTGEEKLDRVLEAVWEEVSTQSWWPKFITKERFDVVIKPIVNRIVAYLNEKLGHNWKKEIDAAYLEELEQEKEKLMS